MAESLPESEATRLARSLAKDKKTGSFSGIVLEEILLHFLTEEIEIGHLRKYLRDKIGEDNPQKVLRALAKLSSANLLVEISSDSTEKARKRVRRILHHDVRDQFQARVKQLPTESRAGSQFFPGPALEKLGTAVAELEKRIPRVQPTLFPELQEVLGERTPEPAATEKGRIFREPRWDDFKRGTVVEPAYARRIWNSILSEKRFLVLLGEPGSGKSVAARFLGYKYLEFRRMAEAKRSATEAKSSAGVFVVNPRQLPPDEEVWWKECMVVDKAAPGSLLIFDDVHLNPEPVNRLALRAWRSRESHRLRFLFVGRPSFERALRGLREESFLRHLPKPEALVVRVASDEVDRIAEHLVRQGLERRNLARPGSDHSALLGAARRFHRPAVSAQGEHVACTDLVVLAYLLSGYDPEEPVHNSIAIRQAAEELVGVPARLGKSDQTLQILRTLGALAPFSQFELSLDLAYLRRKFQVSDEILDLLHRNGEIVLDADGARLDHATRALLYTRALDQDSRLETVAGDLLRLVEPGSGGDLPDRKGGHAAG